jgi:homoserine kinase
LRAGTQDELHQKPREKMFPAMGAMLHAAVEGGALGAWLSGAGSTLAAFAEPARVEDVASAFTSAAQRERVEGRVVRTVVDARGVRVERSAR